MKQNYNENIGIEQNQQNQRTSTAISNRITSQVLRSTKAQQHPFSSGHKAQRQRTFSLPPQQQSINPPTTFYYNYQTQYGDDKKFAMKKRFTQIQDSIDVNCSFLPVNGNQIPSRNHKKTLLNSLFDEIPLDQTMLNQNALTSKVFQNFMAKQWKKCKRLTIKVRKPQQSLDNSYIDFCINQSHQSEMNQNQFYEKNQILQLVQDDEYLLKQRKLIFYGFKQRTLSQNKQDDAQSSQTKKSRRSSVKQL